jgi:uncharacterized protein DUF4383
MTMALEHALSAPTSRWTPARWFLLAVAISHVPLGVGGLMINRSFPIGAEAARAGDSARVFGVLETNGWHSLAALALGVLAAWVVVFSPARARLVALVLGVFHVVLVVQLAVWVPSTFWIASNGADQVVHISTAAGGIVSGLLTRSASRKERS